MFSEIDFICVLVNNISNWWFTEVFYGWQHLRNFAEIKIKEDKLFGKRINLPKNSECKNDIRVPYDNKPFICFTYSLKWHYTLQLFESSLPSWVSQMYI